jgi:hypothetical protein
MTTTHLRLVALLLDLTTLALLREHSRAFPEDDLLLPGVGDTPLTLGGMACFMCCIAPSPDPLLLLQVLVMLHRVTILPPTVRVAAVLQAADQRLLGELALPLAAVSRASLQLEAQGFLELMGQGAALAAATEATAGQLQAEYYRLLAQQAQLQAAHVSQLGA